MINLIKTYYFDQRFRVVAVPQATPNATAFMLYRGY